jgi:pyoverdine/dityrosine biosynthesis protein Dit1
MAEEKSHEPTPAQKSDAEDTTIAEPKPHESAATQILHIIQSYSVHAERATGTPEAFNKFLPIVIKYVSRNDRIRILLPAFPFKSPNTKTVTLGTLPDFGEELALARMNSLGDRIKAVYEPGAEIQICSDGLVYGDVVGVPEETLWAYGEELRDMAARMRFSNLTFVRLWDILNHPGRDIHDREQAKAYYLAHATCLRRELEYRFGDPNFNADEAIKNDKDWQLTYQSYIDYLVREFENHTSAEDVAKRMLVRGKAYVTALQAARGDYIRLSIHDSVGKGKLSVSLIPHEKGTVGYMPWRSAVAVDGNGSYRTVFPGDVRDTHEVVYKNGRPYFLRFKSDLFDWKSSGLAVDFEHLYPSGLIIRPTPASGNGQSLLHLIPQEKVRQLSKTFSPIVLRGFSGSPNESLYVLKADELDSVSA